MTTVLVVMLIMLGVTLTVCHHAIKSESHTRYIGIMNLASEKVGNTVSRMEMNAMNVFDEVGKHLDSPESVTEALHSKTVLNPEIRGYFAAFEPNYFPEMGHWYEPYVHHIGDGAFEMRQVGSVRHNYHKSNWYVRAKKENECFWSDPYYYYDGTDISGHYTTFVKPVYDASGRLACVCGADMTFEWLSKELEHIDSICKVDSLMEAYKMSGSDDFYTVVLTRDGSCIVHPADKSFTITDKEVISRLTKQQSGMLEMITNGVPSTIYYGSVGHAGWTLAVVVPQKDIQKPIQKIGMGLTLIMLLGVIVVWFILRRGDHAELHQE